MMHQRLEQKGQLKVLPQKIQFLNFLYLNRQELEVRIQNELIENPLLELKEDKPTDTETNDTIADFKGVDEYVDDDIPDYKYEYQNYLPESSQIDRPLEEAPDFREELKKQFNFLERDPILQQIAAYIIDSLNDYGMLDTDVDTLTEEYSFKEQHLVEPEIVQKVIKLIQELDPPGIGAFSVKECLLLQLDRVGLKSPICKKGIELLREHYHLLAGGHFEKIKELMNLDDEDFTIIVQYIAKFNPHPIMENNPAFDKQQVIVPDVFVNNEEGQIVVSLNNTYADRLHINSFWDTKASMQGSDKAQSQARRYIKNKKAAATWFILAVQQREATMQKIMEAIVKLQSAYFASGDQAHIKPMILKQVANVAGMDISTVSRATANKYAETPFGMVSLKKLFTEGVHNTDGETISNRIIKENIREMIAGEDKNDPYTDQQLTDMLKKNGIMIARRTVTKYREQLQIPVSHLRKLSGQIQ